MFSPDFLDRFAKAVALRVAEHLATGPATAQGRLMSVTDAADYLGRSKQAIYHLVNQAKIPCKRQGSRLMFDRRDLDRWIDELG